MPNLEIEEKIKKQKEELAQQIAEEAITLSGTEKMQVALAVGCSTDTIDRYSKGEVKRIPTAVKMLAEMKKVNAQHQTTNAA